MLYLSCPCYCGTRLYSYVLPLCACQCSQAVLVLLWSRAHSVARLPCMRLACGSGGRSQCGVYVVRCNSRCGVNASTLCIKCWFQLAPGSGVGSDLGLRVLTQLQGNVAHQLRLVWLRQVSARAAPQAYGYLSNAFR